MSRTNLAAFSGFHPADLGLRRARAAVSDRRVVSCCRSTRHHGWWSRAVRQQPTCRLPPIRTSPRGGSLPSMPSVS